MNKIFKHSMMLLFSALALVLGSCTEEFEYIGATIEGEQVYFSNALSSTVNLDPNASEVKIPVNRIQRTGELTVNFNVTTSENCAVSVPSSVTFADGDSVAYLTVTYDPQTIQMGHFDDVTVAIADANYTTPYGSSSYTFSIGLSEWNSIGTGLYRDAIYANYYGAEQLTYNVEIQENILKPGYYRIVTPYGPGTSFYNAYVAEGPFAWANKENTSVVINATDPNFVYVTGEFYPGTSDAGMGGYGVMHVFSIVDEAIKQGNSLEDIKASDPGLFGTLKDGMITLPTQSIYVNFDDSFTPLGYLDTTGWAIALPGSEFTDYSSSFTYKGRFTDVAGNNYAQGSITLGEDVANAKYVLAADGDDINSIIEYIADGSLEANGITESGDVSIQIAEGGKYTMVIVTFDAEGNMRSNSATTFTFSTGGGSGTANWQPVTSGTYDQNYFPNFITDEGGQPVGNPFGDGTYSTTLYVDGNDQTHYKLEPWLTQEGSLEFTLDDRGIISFDIIDTGVDSQSGYGNVLVVNANDMFADNPNYPFSFYAEEGIFAFGMMYYVNKNGKQGWMGGATETFTPSQSGAPSMIKMPAAKKGVKSYKAVKGVKKVLNAKVDRSYNSKFFSNRGLTFKK